MDAAASAPQAGYGALVRQLSRQLSRQASLDDAAFNLVDLPGELLALTSTWSRASIDKFCS